MPMRRKRTPITTGNGFVRIAVIGAGGMGRGHCRSVNTVPHARLAAVCDVNRAAADEVGRECGIPAFTDHAELIRSGACDLALIATPHPFHMQVALDFMGAGIHVISEKPLTENIATAEKMAALAARRKLAFSVMFQRRFEPNILKAMEIVDGGQVGRVHRAMLIDLQYRTQNYYDAGRWRATWRGEGGGVLMNQSPHMLDLFIRLAGMPGAVYGRIGTRMHKIEVEDQAEALLDYPGGGTGYVYCSTCESGPGQTIEIAGDLGKLVLRDGRLSFYKYGGPIRAGIADRGAGMWDTPQTWEVPVASQLAPVIHSDYEDQEAHRAPTPARHTLLIANVVEHILFGTPLAVPGAEGLRSLELANAITLSSFEGRRVKLPISRARYNALLEKLRRKSKTKHHVKQERRVTDPRHA